MQSLIGSGLLSNKGLKQTQLRPDTLDGREGEGVAETSPFEHRLATSASTTPSQGERWLRVATLASFALATMNCQRDVTTGPTASASDRQPGICSQPRLPAFALPALDLRTTVPSPRRFLQRTKSGHSVPLKADLVAFVRYLNEIHLRIHGPFSDSFLASLCDLPPRHPLWRFDLVSEVGVMVNGASGALESLALTRSSGVKEFDAAAVLAMVSAFPMTPAARKIWSEDGRVYFLWEFHRNPEEACSTYFARPLKFEASFPVEGFGGSGRAPG